MVSRRINAERLVLLGWSRAILLQLAHPLVAAGVAEHSTFRGGPLEAASRLRHTIRAMLALTFGGVDDQRRAIDGILSIHRRVHGRLPEAVGNLPAGTPYSAEDPSLVLWVHATLLESVPMVYQAIIAPLSSRDLDDYCSESAPVAIALGARPSEVPTNWRALNEYVTEMHRSNVLAVGKDAKTLANAVLSSRLAVLAWPLAWTNRHLTIGWLPPQIRVQYGFDWRDRDERRSRRVLRILRRVRRVMPDAVALWPEARKTVRQPPSIVRNSKF
ncbi:MAG TPA: oxygenase MpaB family protein [Vicinamibacterales bacterium]|nr:oxygenase MpaB family protein [Vicinamibacterales bacterium]